MCVCVYLKRNIVHNVCVCISDKHVPGVRRDMGESGQLEYKNTFTAARCPVLRSD